MASCSFAMKIVDGPPFFFPTLSQKRRKDGAPREEREANTLLIPRCASCSPSPTGRRGGTLPPRRPVGEGEHDAHRGMRSVFASRSSRGAPSFRLFCERVGKKNGGPSTIFIAKLQLAIDHSLSSRRPRSQPARRTETPSC